MQELHQHTIDFIEQFERDHFIKLRGTDEQTVDDGAERITGVDWVNGGFHSVTHSVETTVFYPEHFSFDYKGATISGKLKGVSVETQVLVDGQESDCECDDIEAAVEKACGFLIDPYGIEQPDMHLKSEGK